MYRSLIEIDANIRQLALPTRSSSIKPGPTTPVKANNNIRKRLIPHLAASNGSPQSMGRPSPMPKGSVTPVTGSKIPRKSHTPSSLSKNIKAAAAAGATSQPRLSSKSRSSGKTLATSPADQSKPKQTPSPPANLHKELPSPPMAQIVNPLSPVKAKRTLVDATVATPTEDRWPVIRPENIPPAQVEVPSPHEKQLDTLPQAERSSPPPVPKSPPEPPETMESPQALGLLESPSNIGYAFSTDSEAIDSPVAGKKVSYRPTAIHSKAIPNRGSSLRPMRNSLPLRSEDRSSSENEDDPPISRIRRVKPGSTKWPLLDASPTIAPLPLSEASDVMEDGIGKESQPDGEACHDMKSTETYHTLVSQQIATDSYSRWSISDDSSIGEVQEQGLNSSARVKRLSTHTLNSGLGPVLTIASDADTVLFGDRGSVPKTLPFPDTTVTKSSQERSFSALAGRVSRQTMSRISLNKSPQSNIPCSSEYETNATVRITPIRSMQPPRGDGEIDSKIPSPPTLLVGQDSPNNVQPVSTPIHERDISGAFQTKRCSKSIADTASPYPRATHRHLVDSVRMTDPNRRASQPLAVPPKAGQILGINIESLASNIRIPASTPKNVSSFGSSTARKIGADRTTTNPSLIPTARRDSRTPPTGTRLPSSRAPLTPYGAGSRAERRISSGLSKLREIENTGLDRTISGTEDGGIPDAAKERRLQQSTPNTTPSVVLGNSIKSSIESAAKIKTKKSFRDFFHKKDHNRLTAPLPKENLSKRSSITMTGSTLAKRFRNSANSSKVNLPKDVEDRRHFEPEPVPEIPAAADTHAFGDVPAAQSDLTSSSAPFDASPITRTDTNYIINNIIKRVMSLPPDSKDRLRGLEIAESVVHAIETVKQAKISAQKAKKHARDAELHYHTASLGLQRLQKLVEADFDSETMHRFKDLIRHLGLVNSPLEPCSEFNVFSKV